jgi:hypothetical protein
VVASLGGIINNSVEQVLFGNNKFIAFLETWKFIRVHKNLYLDPDQSSSRPPN